MDISLKDLKSQYNRVKKAGWLPIIARAAALSGSTTAHWLAFGSRESNLKNIKGDFRNGIWNGFGPVQVDVGTDKLFASTWRADSPDSLERGFKRGAEIYNLKKNQIINGQGKKLTVRKKSFVGKKPVAADDLRRLTTAAYNSGLWSYYHWSNGQNCDSTTTGKDYSRDVYDRAIEFAALLEADGIEAGALAKEVRLQGKYARKEAIERAGVKPLSAKAIAAAQNLVRVEPLDDLENVKRAGYATEEDFGVITKKEVAAPVAEKETEENENGNDQNENGGGGDPQPAPQTLNQKADQITNVGTPEAAAEVAKIEAAKAAPPVEITAPEPTDFFGKIKKLAYGVVTGTIALPFLDKVFGIQLSPEQIELLKFIFPYVFFGVILALIVWYVTKKFNQFKITKLLAEKNADLTTRNVVIVPPKPLYQITARPHIWQRVKYAITAKPAYIWMNENESSEEKTPEITAVSENAGSNGAPAMQAAK